MPLMIAVALLVSGAESAAAASAAQPPMQVFIAPSGEPFRAPEGQPYPVAQWFAQADANHDGRLTSTEFLVDFMRFFDKLDVNHDGKLDAAEIASYETVIAPEVHVAGGHHEWRGEGGGGGEAPHRGGGRGGHRHGGYGGMEGGMGGGGFSGGGAFQEQHHQDMDEGPPVEQESDATIATPREVGRQARPEGGAIYDLLGYPEPVTAMAPGFDVTVVTRDDARAAASARFDTLDTRGMGYLTLRDLPETYAQRHKGRRK